jgi:FkbM family methyltransferase
VSDGFYIDIGAQDPVVDSVSAGFHIRGWQGIHIEPIPRRAAALPRARPGDLVLRTAIGEREGPLRFFEFPDADGLSTCDEDIAEVHRTEGLPFREIKIPCLPLSELFDRHVHRDVHWLKIDVEGFEGSVIRSWRPSAVRPWVVVVESTVPRTRIDASGAWEADLLSLGYSFVYFDGINRFYLSEAHPELAGASPAGPISSTTSSYARATLSRRRQPAASRAAGLACLACFRPKRSEPSGVERSTRAVALKNIPRSGIGSSGWSPAGPICIGNCAVSPPLRRAPSPRRHGFLPTQ